MNDKSGGRLRPREEWPPAPRIAADLCATSPLPTCVLWGEEHLVAVYNKGFAQALALSQPSYGQPVRDLWPTAWPDLGPTLTRVLRYGEAATLDSLTSEGGAASFQAICTPLRDHGTARGVHLTLWKTTQEVANHQSPAAISGPDQRELLLLRQAMQEAPAAIAVLRGPQHRVELANAAYQAMAPDIDVVGQTVAQLFPETIEQGFGQLLDHARAGHPVTVTDAPIMLRRSAKGPPRQRFFTYTFSPMCDADEQGAGVLVTAHETTEGVQSRHRAEQLAAEVEAERTRLRQVIEVSPEAIALADTTGQIVLSNAAARAIWGQDNPVADATGYQETFGACRMNGAPYPSEELPLARSILHCEVVTNERLYIRNRTTGMMIPVLVNSAPLFNSTGETSGGVVIFQDISAELEMGRAREEAHHAATARAAELEAVLSGMAEPAIVYNGDWQVTLANRAAHDLFRWEEPVEGLHVSELVEQVRADLGPDSAHLAHIARSADQLANSGEALEMRFVHPPRVMIRRSSTMYDPATGAAVAHIALFQDVTAERVAAQEKDDFLSVASHELKTPLTSLRGMAQVAQRRLSRGETERTLESLRVVLEQATRLGDLIDDLLDVSRIQAGHLPLERVPLDLGALVYSAVERHQATTERHQITARVVQPRPVTITGDAGRLAQVLDNLLSNAVKYSPQGGEIQVTCSCVDSSAVVRVRDQGIGIDPAGHGLLFERFYRAHNASVNNFAGLGVGLWISRQIVERHAGQLWLDVTDASGSTFAFRLPLAQPGSQAGDQ